MTEEQSRVEDKYGKDIKIGDRVYFVHGGEHHSMVVEDIHPTEPPDSPYPHKICGKITVHVHAASVTRAYRDADERTQQHEEDPQTAHIDKAQQETETPEADHKPATKTTTKKGSKS